MKLKPTTFYGAFHDGLYLLSGHEFETHGRMWVVHKRRPPYDKFYPSYQVSDKEFGMNIPGIPETRNRAVAATWATVRLDELGDAKLHRVLSRAKEIYGSLKVIEQA